MNVVLYLRYSSDKQTEQSIEGQATVCEEYCAREGHTVVGRYIDRATSAFKQTDRRTEFQRMIRESSRGDWEGVVVYKLDRFARNRYDSATYKAKLKQNGVRLLSATEDISDNPEGVILESVLEGIAEYYSAELSQKVQRGMRETAAKCNSCGGTIPLGYKVENKKLVVDPLTAPIAKELFTLFADGTRKADIVALFNKKGYRTSTGAEWNKNSFSRMLRNEKYIGTYVYNGTRIENAIPALIDRDTWDRVQARIKKSTSHPASAKAKVEYLLTGKLYCGHCGSQMVGESGHSKTGSVYNYYSCMGRRKQHTCHKKNERQLDVEQMVVEETMKLLTPEVIDEIADAAVRACEYEIQNNSIIPQLQAEKAEIDKRINNLLSLAERGVDLDMLSEKLLLLSQEKKANEARLNEVTSEVFVIEKPMVLWWLQKFASGSVDDIGFRRNLIDLLVRKVTLFDSDDGVHIKIDYNLTKYSSDLHSLGAPTENCPNTIVCPGISFCILTGIFSLTVKHPR